MEFPTPTLAFNRVRNWTRCRCPPSAARSFEEQNECQKKIEQQEIDMSPGKMRRNAQIILLTAVKKTRW